MARPRLHSDGSILDAVRDLWVSGGDPATTSQAISDRSGAPIGSLYHRFGSRAVLLARLWTRTVQRFQHGLLDAVAGAAPGMDAALAAAAWTVDFSLRQPADARLLLLARRAELVDDEAMPADLRRTLHGLDEPVVALVRGLASELFGGTAPGRCELVTVAVVDLPYAVVRRHLVAGTLRPAHRRLVTGAARAILTS